MERARALAAGSIVTGLLALGLAAPAVGAQQPEDVLCPRGTVPEATGSAEMPYLCAPASGQPPRLASTEAPPPAEAAPAAQAPRGPACAEIASRAREIGRRLRREGAGIERLRSRIRLVSRQAELAEDRQLADELGHLAAELKRIESARLNRVNALRKASDLLSRGREDAACAQTAPAPAGAAAGR